MLSDLTAIVDAIQPRHRFLLVSHARPDGDAIGSALALFHALQFLGKDVRVVSHDPVPPYLRSFPGTDRIEVVAHVDAMFDAVIVLECGALDRTEITGLDRSFVVNIDHHVGNTHYGALNWFDDTAAACGEMVYELIQALGVPLSTAIATHLYVTILTDTGSFRHSNITTRTFDICRHLAAAGIAPAAIAARVYDHSSIGKLRLTGALLDAMELKSDGRVALLTVDDQLLQETGCAADDMEGLVNLPLNAHSIKAVVMVKTIAGQTRVSLRSKDTVDVRAVAALYGGGGHRNAAGFSVSDPSPDSLRHILDAVGRAIDAAVAVTGP